VLTGRRPLPEVEPAETASAATAAELRDRFVAQIRSGASRMTPAEIGRRVQAILAERELRLNIADFRKRGATVEYHAVDVTHEDSLRALVTDVQTRFGAVTGIVHGAGIIEDKLLVDKTSDSWSRVVETKVIGLVLLQKLVNPDALEFFAVMSSVAGRFGNSGQGDYATANELMNRLCCQLRDRWPATVNVMALCWGPWGPTDFGQGMVNAGVEAKFAEKGVRLVSAACGRRLFGDELRRADREPVEIVCGEGPWEDVEAARGAVEIVEQTSVATLIGRGPLLGNADIEVLPKGERILSVRLDGNHTYLASHRIDGIAILPAAAAVELFAEAGAALWPGWKVVEVRDCRVLKGVDLEQPERVLQLEVSLPTYGSSEGFEVDAVLRSTSDGRPPRTHYRCVLRLELQYPESFELAPSVHAERQLTVEKAYGEWLFHGRCFQVIEQLDGLSSAGGRALVRASSPSEWLAHGSERDRWLFDPAVLDAGPQMAILWARCFRDQTVLPTCFGRVVRFAEVLPARMRMVFECLAASNPQQVRGNVYYVDECDRVVLMVEDLQGIASTALNRLAQGQSLAGAFPLGNV
jgi:NAD(P)-dependent dehydrogenase (short-subunit alcohol dehydrogenase family)